MDTNSNRYWNYRVVVEQEPDIVNKGEWVESVSFRDVYYENGKPTSWGADPQHPIGETLENLLDDVSLMAEALQRAPLIIRDGEIVKEGSYSSHERKLIDALIKPKIPVQSNRELKEEFKAKAWGTASNSDRDAYLVEEKKAELKHAIERAKLIGDPLTERSLIEAYEKFRRDIEQQRRDNMSRQIKPPF